MNCVPSQLEIQKLQFYAPLSLQLESGCRILFFSTDNPVCFSYIYSAIYFLCR